MPARDTEEYREMHTALHVLWTKHTHEAGYDKEEWKRLRDAIEKIVYQLDEQQRPTCFVLKTIDGKKLKLSVED